MTITFDIRESSFVIRPAQSSDAKACRMLLPMMPPDSHFLVALDRTHDLVIGAAGMTQSRRVAPLLGPGVMIEVIEPCREHGVGRALCNALCSLGASQSARALYAAQRCEQDAPIMHLWQRLGFAVCETVEEHELPLAEFVPRLAPLVERLRRQGRIPAEAQIMPLYAADPARVLQLHLDHMGGDRASLYRRIRGEGPQPFHPRYSRVLMVGEQLAGCILAHRQSRHVAAVDANIVAPEFRHGWANVWLKLEATQGALSLGITHFHFTSFDQYEDTRSFTAKLGGVTTKRWALMYRPL